MEPRFGHDFSQVRVHTDAKAAESARAVNALAYTIGQDVFFGLGEYMPSEITGQRLLAHELTHVLQQEANDVPPVCLSKQTTAIDPSSLLRRQANAFLPEMTKGYLNIIKIEQLAHLSQ